ncbi:DUF4232 domain-containing protein [Streptomyces sp. NPDC005840]|uniref:DUF4232 domain-containing protein n=1 Tax=Streptomyces sp. NPDC005840 TaxID=3157072 RepID=UPI00340C4E82
MRQHLSSRPVRFIVAALAAVGLTAGAVGPATALAHPAESDGVGQFCGTNDLKLSLTTKTQAGGYFQIKAQAKPGITCYLDGLYPAAHFGSSTKDPVRHIEQAVSEPVKLSGSLAAYTGINPKSTNNDKGTKQRTLTVAVLNFEYKPVTFTLTEATTVDKPVATNWHSNPADAVPPVA